VPEYLEGYYTTPSCIYYAEICFCCEEAIPSHSTTQSGWCSFSENWC